MSVTRNSQQTLAYCEISKCGIKMHESSTLPSPRFVTKLELQHMALYVSGLYSRLFLI